MPTTSFNAIGDDECTRRSLYMRLYSSRIRGELAYPAQFCAGINALVSASHAESFAFGYRLTEAGVAAWAHMAAPFTKSGGNNLQHYNELRVLTGKALSVSKLAKVHQRSLAAIAAGSPPDEVSIPALLKIGFVWLESTSQYALTKAGEWYVEQHFEAR